MKKLIVALLTVLLAIEASAQLPSNLKAYFPFNGNFNDTLGLNTPGVNTGAVFVNDHFNKPNKAIQFNATNPDYVNIGTDLSYSTTSLCYWIRPAQKPIQQVYLSNLINGYQFTNTAIELRIDSAGKILVFVGCANTFKMYSSLGSVPFGEWSHVGVVIDNFTNLKIYINGVLDFNTSISGITYSKCTYKMHLGSRANPITDNPYNGALDELMIFNKALTDAEVRLTYALTNGINHSHSNNRNVVVTNPVTHHILKVQTGNSDPEGTVSILNELGQCVLRMPVSADGLYDTGALRKGIYVMLFESPALTTTRKIIIE